MDAASPSAGPHGLFPPGVIPASRFAAPFWPGPGRLVARGPTGPEKEKRLARKKKPSPPQRQRAGSRTSVTQAGDGQDGESSRPVVL
jgi:hypothetical protein